MEKIKTFVVKHLQKILSQVAVFHVEHIIYIIHLQPYKIKPRKQ